MYGFGYQMLEDYNDFSEYGNVFAIAPRIDFVDDIQPLHMDMDS